MFARPTIPSFFSERGVAVLQSELLWIWIPAGLLAILVLVLKRVLKRPEENR